MPLLGIVRIIITTIQLHRETKEMHDYAKKLKEFTEYFKEIERKLNE